MQVIRGDRTVNFDCDDTLVMWDLSEFEPLGMINIHCFGQTSRVIKNQKNINLLRKFKKLGYVVVVWSRTGADWAEAVVKALGLESEVDLCISKPLFYVDDQPADLWLGQHVYREMEK